MSTMVASFLVRIFIGGLICAVALILTGEGAQKEVMRLCCAAFMVIVIFTSFSKANLSLDFNFSQAREDTQAYVDDALEKAQDYQFSAVTGQLSNYIEDKGKELGIDCQATLEHGLDEQQTYQVTHVTVLYTGEVTQDRLDQLAQAIESDCGIAREKQTFERRES